MFGSAPQCKWCFNRFRQLSLRFWSAILRVIGAVFDLVRLGGDACCSAHCKWLFMRDGHLSCVPVCVAGAIFCDVGVWLLLLRALRIIIFHLWQTSTMRVTHLVILERHCFLWPAQHLVLDRQFVPGAAFGDVGVLLSVAGAAFGDVRVSLFLENASPKREK